MTYRSLLVHLDSGALNHARTASAIQLAKALDCHLVGLAPTGTIGIPSSTETAAGLVEYAAMAWDSLRDQAEQAMDKFRAQCLAAGAKSSEAVTDEADPAPSLVRHAHCSDLVVLTQADPAASTHATARDLVEQVVLHSARPTLVLPHATPVNTIGSKVMVAWDDSREATRAMSDALPLLRLAQSVQVVSWEDTPDGKGSTLKPRLDALHQWLMWHGVSADLRVEVIDGDLPQSMLSRASDLNADLIVMGAYGHARWVERLLGGATRSVLTSMTVPVLMSH